LPFVRKNQDWKTLVLLYMCTACRTQTWHPHYMSALLIMKYVCSLNSCFCQLTDDLKFTFICSNAEGCHSLRYSSDWSVEQDWTVKEDHWQLLIRPLDVHWLILTVLFKDLQLLLSERRWLESQCKLNRKEEHVV